MSPVDVSLSVEPVKKDRLWTSAEVMQLRRLLEQSQPRLSLTEIARLLQRRKNSVIGKCHREQFQEYRSRTTADLPAPTPPPIVFPESRRCLWPFGDPGDPGFRFCGAPTVCDRPWCREHHARAHLKEAPHAKETAARIFQ